MLGPYIKEHRSRSLKTQEDIATAIGFNVKTVIGIEKDTGTLQNFETVLRYLGLRVAGLPIGQNLGEQLRTLRLKRGWSKVKLAKFSGISRPTIINLESGKGQLSSFYKVLDALRVKVFLREDKKTAFNQGVTDSWNTSKEFVELVHSVVGQFCLDPATNPTSHVRANNVYYEKDNGLAQDWVGEKVWLNPPYSQLALWVQKAHDEHVKGNAKTIVALLPARTNTSYFHDLIAGKAHVIFIKKRLKFGTAKQQAPFPSLLAVWGGDDIIGGLAETIEGTVLPTFHDFLETQCSQTS
jgi:phage N-6-adenine-methyltransferase